MWISLVEGFLFGLGAAIPLGPINILIMSNALRNYPGAVAIGFGAMSADTIYLLAILFGMMAFVKNPTVMFVLGLVGSVFLLYMAWMIFKARHEEIHLSKEIRTAILPNYFKGLSLTLLNPYTIVFWISVSVYIQTRQLDTVFTVVGMFSGILLWITLMPLLIHKTKHLLSQRAVTIISIVSAALLSFFALGMLYRLFS
ncbi:MAG: LysE family translocator [Sulfurovum sp.]|nr:LysE family translocator [Sulfurovum sp.]